MDSTKYFCQDRHLLENREFGIRVLGIHERMSPQIIHRPLGTPDYFVCMFYGPFVLKTPRGILGYPANRLMIWPPGTGHYYGHPTRSWEHTWMHVFGRKVDRLFASARLPVGEPFEIRLVHLPAKYLRMILDEIVTEPGPDTTILCNIFHSLLRELQRDVEQRGEVGPTRALAEVKAHIEANYRQKLTLGDLARRANLSVPQFCARYKQLFGNTAIDYQIRLRMQEAAFLMRDVNMNVSQIAQACGYDDLSYFSRLFRRTYGKSPRKYRQRLLGRA